ncbi:MAG: hypothetical protein ACI91F_003590 [Candidatus Binatia bacterium]
MYSCLDELGSGQQCVQTPGSIQGEKFVTAPDKVFTDEDLGEGPVAGSAMKASPSLKVL